MDAITINNRVNETSSRSTMTIGVAVRLITFSIIGVITYFAFVKGITLFSWHPPLMLVGFLFLMTEAILSFSTDNFLTKNLTHSDRLSLHWKLQSVAAACIFAGFLCIFCNKIHHDREHFASWHGSFGLWTLLLGAGTIGGGIIAKYGYHYRHIIAPVILKSMHAAFGIGVYILAIFTISLGMYSDWLRGHLSDNIIYVFIVGVFLIEFYVLIKPTLTVVTQVKK